MRTHYLVLASLLAPAIGLAQVPLPTLVKAGLDSLRVGHCEAALKVWTSSWTSPDDLAKRQTLIDSCGMPLVCAPPTAMTSSGPPLSGQMCYAFMRCCDTRP